MLKKLTLFVIGAAGILACVSACSSYDSAAQNLRANWSAGNFSEAEKIAREQNEKAAANDALPWQLDYACVLRAAGKTAEASAAFERAAETLSEWDEKPETLLSKEALAQLTNLSALPYRGRSSDAVMLHAYRALSFLENGNSASARVALNAAYRAQQDAVERNEKEIAAAREEADKNAGNAGMLSAQSDVEKEIARERQAIADVRVLADYVNPFATWLYGVYFLHAGEDNADVERARHALSRVAKMYPKNHYVAEDLALCENGKAAAGDALTYVVFESGLAPTLGITRVDLMLPIPIGAGRITPTPVSIVLPKLVMADRRNFHGLFPFASVQTSGGNAQASPVPDLAADGIPAEEICDMNSVVRTDFDNAFPAVLTRTLVTSFVKSAASAAANAVALEYARRNNGAGAGIAALATVIGTSAFTYASSGADVRCWQTLPQNFSVVRMKTPASQKISVRTGARSQTVALVPGRVNLVVVKTTGTAANPVILQSVLAE